MRQQTAKPKSLEEALPTCARRVSPCEYHSSPLAHQQLCEMIPPIWGLVTDLEGFQGSALSHRSRVAGVQLLCHAVSAALQAHHSGVDTNLISYPADPAPVLEVRAPHLPPILGPSQFVEQGAPPPLSPSPLSSRYQG